MCGHHWAKIINFIHSFSPTNKAPKVKRGAKTLRARALDHFGQRVDESPMYQDDFGVS